MSRKKAAVKVSVTMRALVQRINRKISHDWLFLKAARSTRASRELGRYYVVNVAVNAIVEKFVDPTELAHEIGVLKRSERVVGV